MSELSPRDIERIAEAVAQRAPHPCSAFTPGELATLKAFIKRLDVAGDTAWTIFVGAILVFLLGALGYGIIAKLRGAAP